jgi:drug/metabolite transporter (DMT)-like permease
MADSPAVAAASPSASFRAGSFNPEWFTASAPLIFVVIWSTGFIGAKYGLPYAGPFVYLGLRMGIACALMIGLALVTGSDWPKSWREASRYSISGLLLQAGYLGGVFFAISRGMTAGLSSLVVGMQPILVAVIAQKTLGDSVSRRQWLGLLLGFAGVAIVVVERMRSNGGLHGSTSIAADIAILIGLLSTTLGTIFQKRHNSRMPLASGTAIQYGATAAVMLVLALFTESFAIDWDPKFIIALTWQVLVLSVLAVTMLMMLIRQHSVSRLSSYLYLVPPLTALEASVMFHERLSLSMLVGMVVVAAGIVLVVRAPQAAK